MTPNEYQSKAFETVTTESWNLEYLTLGLTSEAGEVAGKVKKIIRGDYTLEDIAVPLANEVGDTIWYCSQILKYLGIPLETVMRNNIQKLQARQQNNTIKGSGDER